MDHTKLTGELTSALGPWLHEVLLYLRQQPDLMADLRKCMNGARDIRIVFHTRDNTLTIEAIDYEDSTVAELFRQTLVPTIKMMTVASLIAAGARTEGRNSSL